MEIHYGQLKIDRISNTSGLFTGDNRQSRWKNLSKVNEAFGGLSGEENKVAWNQSILIDQDQMDIGNQKKVKRNEEG